MIIEITDKKSHAILEYLQKLSKYLISRNLKVKIYNWNNALKINSSIAHFHYSNSTSKILLPLFFSANQNFVTIHDVLPRNNFKRIFLSPLIYCLINLKTKKIITHSNFSRNLLLKNYPFINKKKVKVIHFGNEIKNISEEEISKIRKRLKISKEEIILLYVGYIKKSKGIFETIEAFKNVESNNLSLCLIGKIIDDETKKYLETQKDTRIKVLGFVSNKELENWQKISNALINFRLNSVGETSASVINMLGFGKPVLATDVGSNSEIIKNAGLFCKIDIDSIKIVISRYASQNNLRLKLEKNAKLIRNNYDWNIIVREYEKLFYKYE